ncbi:membrane protein insertion efficiency factor YidD [Janthinobacterium sp. SUN033]|uniref:membrane protein insertion efficiency factor YidD n=1 Tax=Janthinobacterium sp. SUN033 TaxID=3002439 RepID=UPI0025B25325|nr:membrane protein insertion efficiency factor YidD [Janthinobacterium sp. SUN033]MDN2677197.1 membrane protein insertion efficiency factor YidD [Janthinobacterium sp. SUN033]
MLAPPFHPINATGQGERIFSFDTCGTQLALWAIGAYQRYLSPHKGFSCAYRVLTGRDSCSVYGRKVIARHGLRPGLSLLRRRLHSCSAHHRLHQAQSQTQPQHARGRSARHRAQAGYCDLQVPDCGDCACDCADIANLADCTWPGRSKNPKWFRNDYAASAALKRQQEEHRKKLRQGRHAGN